MLHTSIKLDTPCEFINIVPLNPQISKCQIKVCYVGDAPNRNKSIITKEVAKQIANSLPGSPIVGYYRKDKEDFDQHSKGLYIEEGQLKIKDLTRPYGFVDLNAKCWFQKYIDDGVDEHEYLVTEGYLWTGQYPECRDIFKRGQFNQSMELNNDLIDAYWSKDNNGKPQFFIINEALISKLCILGDDVDPCFEGASISKAGVEFSFDDDFKQEMREMFYQLQETLKEGGIVRMDKEEKLINNEEIEYKKKEEEEKENTDTEKNQDENKQEDTSKNEENTEKTSNEQEDEDKKKKTKYSAEEENAEEEGPTKYSLEDIPEYQELKTQYSALEEKYNTLVKTTEDLTSSLTSLQEFKKVAERKEKEELIGQFYMLSDQDKEDVQKNIDTYSLEDIESKLSVICFRKKVDLKNDIDHAKEEEKSEVITYNVHEDDSSSVPAWVKAVAATQEKM